jgi:hypothetical protein
MPERKVFIEEWSAMSQGDLGLHASYWTGQSGDPVIFRPIVGWVTFNARPVDAPPGTPLTNGFGAVVLSDTWWPVLASHIAHYGGVFPKDLSPEATMAKITEWRAPGAEDIQMTGREIGKA